MSEMPLQGNKGDGVGMAGGWEGSEGEGTATDMDSHILYTLDLLSIVDRQPKKRFEDTNIKVCKP